MTGQDTRTQGAAWRPLSDDDLVVRVVRGPDAGRSLVLRELAVTIGTSSGCGLRLTDPTVSREHLRVLRTEHGVELVDLDSKNGSSYGGARFRQLSLRPPAVVRVGDTDLEVAAAVKPTAVAQFGAMIATSAVMRKRFQELERLAQSNVPVLIYGETGTGKELVAQALHAASPRRAAPLVLLDLAGIPEPLLESELFGHVRGAFTGAAAERQGAFEAANGGTVFLDEIGELALGLQPRLLRVLETGETKRVGSNTYRKSTARIVAATNRDLEEEVAEHRFRADLFHRVATVTITLPPLRDRPDDIPVLVRHILEHRIRRGPEEPPVFVSDEVMAGLVAHDWPGNVRQLRNVLERAAALSVDGQITLDTLGLSPTGDASIDTPIDPPSVVGSEPLLEFKDAKRRLVAAWERDYVTQLIARCGGNLTEAARVAGIARGHLHRLIRKRS